MQKYLNHEPQNILVLRLGGIGEIIAITPALRALRKRYPNANITLFAQHPSYQIIDGAGLVNKVVCLNALFGADGLKSMLHPKFVLEFFKLASLLTATRYDLFLDFQHLYYRRSIFKPFVISVLSRASRRIGFNSYNRGFFLTDKVDDPRMARRHLIYRNVEFLKPLGIKIDSFEPIINISSDDITAANNIISGHNLNSNHLIIGINPASSRPATRWGEDRFCALIDKIFDNFNANVVLVGSADENDICERIAKSVKGKCINLAGKTTIGQVAGIIKKLNLFISNDTGPLHISYAFRVPTIGIFRPGEYPIWGSYSETDRFAAVYEDVWCAPCYRYTCDHHTCMKLVEVDDVYRQVERLLKNRK